MYVIYHHITFYRIEGDLLFNYNGGMIKKGRILKSQSTGEQTRRKK